MNDTITTPIVGQRVRVISVNAHPECSNQNGTVVGFYSDTRPLVVLDNGPACIARENGSWAISTWEIITPEVGDKVIAVEVPGMEEYNGKVGTVTQIGDGFRIYAEFQSIQKPDDTEQFYFYAWKPLLSDGEHPVIEEIRPSEETGIISDLQEQVRRLTAEVERHRSDSERATGRANMYASDFQIVGAAIMEEAERRGWCSDYDEFVEEVNAKTALLDLPTREQDYEVEVTITGTLTTTHTVTVTATSQEAANELVSDSPHDYVTDADDILTSAARHHSFDDVQVEIY